MSRVYVVVEGATEESFVNQALAPTLWPRGVYLTPITLGIPGQKGGNTNYARVKKDVLKLLKQHREASCSTMLDFYGLGKGFPGAGEQPGLTSVAKAERIEQAVREDIAKEYPDLRGEVRFIPYLQVHEYEALLFSDPEAFASGIGQPNLAPQFRKIRAQFPTPEDINDDPNTAPSKRLQGIYPAYRKVTDGTLAARAVTVEKMRQQCPHFREWLHKLQQLAAFGSGV